MRTIVLILCITVLSNILYSQEEVKRKDGKTIIINKDGTWNYKQELKAKADVKKQIVEQMVRGGQLEQSCIENAGSLKNAIDMKSVLLSTNGQQYLMSGGMCGFGANEPYYWLYELREGKIRMIGDIGAANNVKVTRNRSNGYYDLEIVIYFRGSGETESFNYRYNGSTYLQVK